MRYMIGSQMGWAALPFIVFGAIAYIWVAEKLAGRSTKTHLVEQPATKIAKAA